MYRRGLKRVYGASAEDVNDLVEGSRVVASWLGRYKASPATFLKYSRGLTMFFKWLREVKGLKFSPEEFLDLLAA